MRDLRFLPVLALLVVGMTACVPPIGLTCSAIGYSSQAHITLSEPRAGVTLELCDGEGCAPGPPMAPVEIQEVRSSTPPSAKDTGVLTLAGNGASRWTADLIGGQPVVGYRVTDSSGMVIAEGTVNVDWVRVGGTAQCGGPREAEITLPS